MSNYTLEVINLKKSFKKKEVLKGVSFKIKSGEIYALIGENGAGKSTTIKSIVGILPLSEGNIFVDGISVKEDPISAKKMIGFIDDEASTFDEMTGREFIDFIASIYKVDKKNYVDKFNYLVNLFSLSNDIDNYIKNYSHGMKEKVVIISTLIHNPKLWIMDEPLTGLDILSVNILIRLMKEYVKSGNSILLTSHNIQIVNAIGDKAGILKNGIIAKEIEIDTLRKENKSLEELFIEMVNK